ncbi:MAG TPA: AAA family ATPase [Gemmatimonadales bacterium]|nr:AAA family ATPase [Gemmatimonadales bacterium]
MIPRRLLPTVTSALAEVPAVALLGPRQVGKTTLAHEVAKARPRVYLDLESEADRAKLADPELYLSQHEDKLVILDEVHRTPQLFRSLRGLIDASRRRGRGKGRFLVLGSASMDLLRLSSESLAGRIRHLEDPVLGEPFSCITRRYARRAPGSSGLVDPPLAPACREAGAVLVDCEIVVD